MPHKVSEKAIVHVIDEVRTVIRHVTKRLRQRWPSTRIAWHGDSHYGRVEAMEWAENNGADYILVSKASMPPWSGPLTICAFITPGPAYGGERRSIVKTIAQVA
jgi:hypothetical protein